MNELNEATKAWPIIIHGALSSALFWLVLVIFQWARSRISDSFSHHSKATRLSWLINEKAKYEAITSDSGLPQIESLLFLFYRASRPLLKSLMWLVYGLTMDAIISPVGVFAYMVCIYYLFKAFEIVAPLEDKIDPHKRLKEITDEISKPDKT
jgi:hypothetical protein